MNKNFSKVTLIHANCSGDYYLKPVHNVSEIKKETNS